MSTRRPEPRRAGCRSVSLLLALLAPAVSGADASVWRVSGEGSEVFLGGTIHRLSPDHYPLPAEYHSAYERADVVVFETDIAAMRSPDVRARIARLSRLPEGSSLTDMLEEQTSRELEQFCAEAGVPLARLLPLRPAPAMLTLLSVTLARLGYTAPGVDEHFYERAAADDKPVQALETVDEQIGFLLSLDQGRPDLFVRRSIEDLRRAHDGAMTESLAAWRSGRSQDLVEHFIEEQMLYMPELYQTLLVERNRQWMGSIRRYLSTPETELVLVGVGHVIGGDGLIRLLEDEGFSVEQLDGGR